jgi:chaperonin cofactor prefoldin
MSDEHTEPVEQAKEEADREVADLEERSEQVGERIEETRKDWQAKQADDGVPGAVGDPDDDRGTDDTPDQAA